MQENVGKMWTRITPNTDTFYAVDNVVFTKQVSLHPRNRLARVSKDDVVFVKQLPVHSRDRLVRATKDDVVFVKQIPVHQRDRLKRKTKKGLQHPRDQLKENESQVARDNVRTFMEGKFKFSPEKRLNKLTV